MDDDADDDDDEDDDDGDAGGDEEDERDVICSVACFDLSIWVGDLTSFHGDVLIISVVVEILFVPDLVCFCGVWKSSPMSSLEHCRQYSHNRFVEPGLNVKHSG